MMQGGKNTMGYLCESQNCGSPRSFFTKAERVEMLKEYKEVLDNESKGVAEKIADLESEE